MTKDLANSIKAALYDRTASPLFGTLAVSWIVWNHRLLITLFSPIPVADRFAYIDETFIEVEGAWLHLWGYPLLTTILILFVYPYPARFVFWWWRTQQKKQRSIKQKIEDETLLTAEESRRVRRENIELQVDYENQLRQVRNDRDRLKEALNDSQEQVSNLQEELNNSRKKADNEEDLREKPSSELLESILTGGRYRLVFNPDRGTNGSKPMTFKKDGVIEEGKNKNENSWRIVNEQLELVQQDGHVHSRFDYSPPTGIFTHTGESDTLSGHKNQYIVPEPG